MSRKLSASLIHAAWVVIFSLLSGPAFLQTDAVISPALEKKFQKDAARLALRSMTTQGELQHQNVEIPAATLEKFYSLLSAIYMNDSLARNIEECNVHTFPNPSIDHLVVIYKKSASWASAFQKENGKINHPGINRLVVTYDLVIEKKVQWNDGHNAFIVRSDKPLNMAALAKEFYKIEGVTGYDLGIPTTLGNDIRIRRIRDGWEISYLLFFGSHLNKAAKLHTWIYQVTDDGYVKFIAEKGDELPEWMDCAK